MIKLPKHHAAVIANFNDLLELLIGIQNGKYEDTLNLRSVVMTTNEIRSMKYGYVVHTIKQYSKFLPGQNILVKDKAGRVIGTGEFIQSNWNLRDEAIYHRINLKTGLYDKKLHTIVPAT